MVEASNNSFHEIESILKNDPQICFDVASVLIITLDKTGAVVLVNKTGVEMLGYSREEIIGKNWFDMFVPAEEKADMQRVFLDMMEGRSQLIEYYKNKIVAKNGERLSLVFHNALLTNKDGLAIGTISSGQDVTIESRLSESLTKQENLTEVVSDNLPIGYAVNTISNGKAIFMNKKFEEIYGWPRSIITSVDTFFDHVYPDPEFRKKLKEQVMMDIMSANPARMIWKNLPITRESGEVAYITAQNIPLYEHDLMVSTVMDVTHQVTMEKALRESDQLQRTILDNLTDLIFVKDKDGKYITANAPWLTFINKTITGVLGKTDKEIFPEEYAEKYQRDDAEVIKTREQKRIKETSVDSNGVISHFETVKTPLYNGDEFIGIIGVAHVIK